MRIAISHCGMVRRFTETNREVDNEPQNLLINLARNNPNDEFLFFGVSSDSVYNERMFPNKNVKFVRYDNKNDNHFIEQGPVDLLIMYSGVSTPGITINEMTVSKEDKSKRQAVSFLMTKHYTGPILKYINHFNQKYIAFSNDPRHCAITAKDLHVRPIAHYAQSEWEVTFNKFFSYDDRTFVPVKSIATYFPLERIRVLDKIKPVKLKENASGFGLICNQGADNAAQKGINQRWPILKEWLLDATDAEFEVYGKWSEDKLQQDKRMKGRVDRHILVEKVKNWKYSLCIPIADGWNTAKYVELIESHIVPFLYPGYDSKKLVNFPDILRLEKPSDLWDRMAYLDNNPAEYEKLMYSLFDLVFNDDWITGKTLNELIYSHVKDDYVFNYIPSEYTQWDEFFKNKVLVF